VNETWIDRLSEKIFPRRTLNQMVAEDMRRATIKVQQARDVIVSHQFQEHMALAEIAAMEAWNTAQRAPREVPHQPV
jgi:hypothetical protein